MLCGTPAPNDASDVVHQFDIADAGITFADVPLPREPAAVQQIVTQTITEKGVYLRRLKSDVLPDLPPKSFHRVQTPLTKAQSNLYKRHLEQLASDVARTTDDGFKANLTSFMARRVRLLQICSCPDQVDPSFSGVPSKLLAMDQLLLNLIEEQNEKVIVWSFFRSSVESIFKRYAKYNPVRIDGSISDTQVRADAVERFQTDDTTMLFVANPAAAGAGLTLTRSRIAIYESFSSQAAHYMQSLDRIHRRGQGRDVNYYVLLSEGTIEEDEYDRLLRKEQQAADLFGDSVAQPARRELFLRELLDGLRKFTRIEPATLST